MSLVVVEPWWRKAKLRTILTEPRRHELTLTTGHVVRLAAADFLSVSQFSAKYLDACGSFPELPSKKAGLHLREIASFWFQHREVVSVEDDGTDRGLIASDVRTYLRSAPETEDGADLDRGAIIPRGPAGFLFNARIALDRVRRFCPVKFSPADFHEALRSIGCECQGVVRIGSWRGRAWVAPLTAMHEPDPTALNGHAAVAQLAT
jgi:hypothetical protein